MTDADSAVLSGAMVQITANYQSSEDVLAFTNTTSISGSWNATTGTLTLAGSASPADYQAALRSVTYRDTSDTPSMLARTVSFTAADAGGATSTAATREIEFAKAAQATLTITGPASATYGHADYAITTSGGSGTGTVTFDAGQLHRVLDRGGQAPRRLRHRDLRDHRHQGGRRQLHEHDLGVVPGHDQGIPGHHVRCPVGQDLRRPRLHGQRHSLVRPPDQLRGQRPVQH